MFRENPFFAALRLAREKFHIPSGIFNPFKFRLRVSMDGAQKELMIAGAILLLTGFMTYHNWDSIQTLFGSAPPDPTITSWVENHAVGADPSKPVGDTNPADPDKSSVVTAFAGHDGKLLIVEHPQSASSQPQLSFTPDRRRTRGGDFRNYRDEIARIAQIKDEARQTITFAAYMAAGKRPMGLLDGAELTADQRKVELAARDQMMQDLEHLGNQIYDGSFNSAQFQAFLDLLAKYKLNTEDPLKSSDKQKMARQIMDMGMKYLNQEDDARAAIIARYVDIVDNLLQSDQRQKLVAATKDRMAHFRERFG